MQHNKNLIQVDIFDAHRSLYSGLCESVFAQSLNSEVCIMFQHTPLWVKLIPGELRIKTDTKTLIRFYVSGGCLEIVDAKVSVQAEQLLRADEIDKAVALQSKLEAETILHDYSASPERKSKAEILLAKAVAQLKIVEHRHNT